MHLSAKRPLFVPEEYCDEIEKMSKAALMDMAWDLVAQLRMNPDPALIMEEFRKRREIILFHRKDAKSHHPRATENRP